MTSAEGALICLHQQTLPTYAWPSSYNTFRVNVTYCMRPCLLTVFTHVRHTLCIYIFLVAFWFLYPCTHICVFKGNLPAEYDWIAKFHSVASGEKGENHVTIIRSPHVSKIDYHYMHSNTSIQRQLTCWVWLNRKISQCSKWGKGEIMLPLSDHLTRQG